MLRESKKYLSSFMVKCFREQRGPFETNPLAFFADVTESINGRRDPPPATNCQAGFVFMMVT